MTTTLVACEKTGKKILLLEGYFVADPNTGNWSFVSADAPEASGEYDVAVTKLVKSPEALVDWMAHLNEKTWFVPQKFFDFFTKFRKANKLFGEL